MKISLAYINKKHLHFSILKCKVQAINVGGNFIVKYNKYDIVWDYNMAVFSDVLNKSIVLEANILQLRPSRI